MCQKISTFELVSIMITKGFCGRENTNIVKKVRYYADRNLYFRIVICICVFAIIILCLLHCSNLDSTARVPPSPSSKIKPSSHFVIQGSKSSTFSFFISGKPHFHDDKPSSKDENGNGLPPFHDKILSFSSSNVVENLPLDPIYSQTPPPSSSNNVQGSSFTHSTSAPARAATRALQGLGTLFIKGTMAVSELVIAHVERTTSLPELRMFLRTFHRSGMSARTDLVLLFASNGLSTAMEQVVLEEHVYLCKLLSQHNQKAASSIDQASNNASHFKVGVVHPKSTICAFKSNVFVGRPDTFNSPIWGCDFFQLNKKKEAGNASMEIGFGSVVGFDVAELNPDNNLQGFIDNPPLSLRRWACYQMLLGMVKHEFKHVLLTAVSGVLILGDPLAMARKSVGLHLSLEDITWGAPITIMDDVRGKFGGSDSRVEGSVDAGKNIGIEDPEDAGKDTVVHKNEGVFNAFEDLDTVMHMKMSLFHAHEGMKTNKIHVFSQHTEDELRAEAQKTIARTSTSSGSSKDIDVPGDKYHKSLKQGMGRLRKLNTQRKGYTDRRRVRQIRKTQKVTGGGGGGLYERVYGRRMWNMLDDGDKRKKLVNRAAILGDVRHVHGVAVTMVTEIVKVALNRGSREGFPDSVVLSHLVHNRNLGVLGKKVVEHIHILENSASFVHSVGGSEQPTLFSQERSWHTYPMISEGQGKQSRLWRYVVELIHEEICSSSVDAAVYNHCVP